MILEMTSMSRPPCFALLSCTFKLLIMMGLWTQAGSTFNRVVKPRGSVDAEDNPPSDTEPDDTSILFVPTQILPHVFL